MKRFLAPSLVAIVFLGISTIQGQTGDVFELTDGYFQEGVRKPVPLMKQVSRQPIRLGESIHLWYTLTLRDGQNSPCTRKGEKPCETRLEFVSDVDQKVAWYYPGSLRIDDRLDIAHGFSVLRDKTPLGDGMLVYRIEFDGKVLFSHQIPVEVK